MTGKFEHKVKYTKFNGVVGVDITISALSKILNEIKFIKDGFIVLTDPSGKLYNRPEPFHNRSLTK